MMKRNGNPSGERSRAGLLDLAERVGRDVVRDMPLTGSLDMQVIEYAAALGVMGTFGAVEGVFGPDELDRLAERLRDHVAMQEELVTS
jgi:hypothetical protein